MDVLVVDEAGQFSRANALAVSVAVHSLVLLGDPQQLAQPSQDRHPLGAEGSALEHLLDSDATLAKGKGRVSSEPRDQNREDAQISRRTGNPKRSGAALLG
ncbi:MAG: hypothetical protein ABI895_43400 [Deltaproteobacteria bacterium]